MSGPNILGVMRFCFVEMNLEMKFFIDNNDVFVTMTP